jgi:hypothetical protein
MRIFPDIGGTLPAKVVMVFAKNAGKILLKARPVHYLDFVTFVAGDYQPRTVAKISGATEDASDLMTNFGMLTPSLPQVGAFCRATS